jgi:2-methylcitrate dehydratase PrpD
MVPETARLAEFCAALSFERLPADVVRTVKRIVLDTLGTTLAASTLGDGCAELVRMARDTGGAGEATLIGSGTRVPALMAALANGGMGHALNFDAGGDAGHLGSVVAAPLASAELRGGLDGRRFIASLAAGLELMARLAAAMLRAGARDQAPGDRVLEGQLLGYFGAAGAAGSCLGLDAARMHSALGIALMQAAGSRQVLFDGDPPAKAVYAAFSNHGGLLSALLARQGLAAPLAAFEGEAGLFALHFGGGLTPGELVAGLGERFHLLDVAFKPWPSSGITHPFIEAAQGLGTFRPDALRAIALRGGTHARHWFEPEDARRNPATSAAAANSVFYTVACALAHGDVTLDHFTPSALPRAAPMIALMRHALEEELGSSGIVELLTRDGRTLANRIDARLGTRDRPMSDDQLARKFADCARFSARPVAVDALVEMVLGLEKLPDMAQLCAKL